jgi:nuclear pore complex protein Nup205
MTLVKCFTRLPRDRRETMLSDLLQELPPIIRSGSVTESTAVLLSEVSLSLITKLREDWRSQQLLGVSSHSGSLSSERLYALLRSFLECVLDYRVELVRGNLYAALVNYFHLATGDPGNALSESSPPTTMALYISSTALTPDESLGGSLAVAPPRPGQLTSTTSTEILAVLKPVAERLVTTISRDATDGTEVWKTVAYMLLDCLVDLSHGDKQGTILSTLVRHGFLGVFVQDIKDSDRRLQAVLKPEPGMLSKLPAAEWLMVNY